MITAEDYRQISYFWNEKGDFTRYSRWKDIEAEMREKQPEFFLAYDQMQRAKKTFDFVLDTLVELEGREEE